MNNNNYWNMLLLKIDKEAQESKKKQKDSFAFYQMIESSLDTCLSTGNYQGILELEKYFEDSKRYPNIIHSGETRRVYVMILFLKIELEKGITPYISSVSSYQQFMDQYIQTIFALRRIELQMDPMLVDEAVYYIRSIPLTSYAAAGIITNEYFENHKILYWNIYEAKKDQWSISEQMGWLYKLINYGDDMRAYLALSSLCMENCDYLQAYEMLEKISNPNSEIKQLMNCLKEVISK